MIPPAFAQLVVSAVSASTQMHHKNAEVELARMQLRALESQLDHHTEIAEIQASVARDLIHALIERRIEAVQSGFKAVLSLYEEQAKHYMQQQKKFVKANFKVTDPLESAKYRARLAETDRELTRIREDSQLLYQEMNAMLYLIGGTPPPMPPTDPRTLMP